MKRYLALSAFVVVAVIADIAVVSAVAAATDISADLRSLLLTFFGVLIGMYGLKLFARMWPKERAGWIF